MFRITKCCWLPFSALLLMAADPSWKVKPLSQWTEADAKQLLVSSPWVKETPVAFIPDRGEAQLREGGQMGGSPGVAKRPGKDANIEVSKRQALMVRWESAAAVRAAELIAHEDNAPDWDGDYYVIAVYDVPGVSSANQKMLAAELRRTALLKRDAKKDLKPARVDVVLSAGKLARIVYLFPRSIPISSDDKRIEFTAQIGRLSMAQHFFTEEMQLQGKLEL